MCPFVCRLGVAIAEAGKAVLRDRFWGWIERLSGKVTTEEVVGVYLDMTCHYQADGSLMGCTVPRLF